jgi:hypothetical protein
LAGERGAEALLLEQGYRILDRQASLDWEISIDGEPLVVGLRADFLVEADGRSLVAEVKTGDAAPLLSTPATRRQLLEYLVAYDADGVLLVDVEAGVVAEVDFFAGGNALRTGSPDSQRGALVTPSGR